MTATATRIHPGRPPAAPAPTHTCTPVRDVFDVQDGTLLWTVTCLVCGAPLTGLEVVR